jgi:DNA recombination protein RmuC
METAYHPSTFRAVEQLERVHKGIGEMQSLATGVGDLKKVPSNVTVRGALRGESVVDAAGRVPEIRNATFREGTHERVEFAVRVPGCAHENEVLLPIDAKFRRRTTSVFSQRPSKAMPMGNHCGAGPGGQDPVVC